METLPDPCKDRICKSVSLPPNKPLPESLIYPYKGMCTTVLLIKSPILHQVKPSRYYEDARALLSYRFRTFYCSEMSKSFFQNLRCLRKWRRFEIYIYWFKRGGDVLIWPVAKICIGADEKNKPDWKLLKDFLLKEGPIRKDQITKMLKDGIALMGKWLRDNHGLTQIFIREGAEPS